MQEIFKEIIDRIRAGKNTNAEKLAAIIRKSNRGKKNNHNAKKYLLPYYLNNKDKFNLSQQEEEQLLQILRVKPKRSASGVATITVITKPWPCGGNCIYCPNDIRMPKSYLSDEPACQRAERNYFDPYMQVTARLKALTEMGHNTDKVELIVLGGTFNDYEEEYQRWFVRELFRALNEEAYIEKPEYKNYSNNLDELKEKAKPIQEKLNKQEISYNEAHKQYYTKDESWQTATWEKVEKQQNINENAKHRCVGLVFETRPQAINNQTLTTMRRLGATKIQIGIQSLDKNKMDKSERSTANVKEAFELLRLFGFKIHAHFMVNLPGATPESDKADFEEFVTNPAYLPDEIKLYPCMLVESARLNKIDWQAYDEETLVDVLVNDVENTPCFTRISRMMRDISSKDITQGVKKTNLRQMVEEKVKNSQEIRAREIVMDTSNTKIFDDYKYQTSNTEEHFLQYITDENKILGFLRLSLPKGDTAMIREVHVYGRVAKIGEEAQNAQHQGLGTKLIETACDIAKKTGYKKIRVISAVGTRPYYQRRGFKKSGLYQELLISS
ncbi:MAG: tRNA uridine(34) 5-carboxymethylaminomethyl modification radical SAM/GNAT enzyme Elp3 [Coriobacteriia bacterium]|nr:tRNA uridine(34) 5-carboxymethylaminomethyl modification radical SAM/GNAT enzyme Elp3 [Coriobacteriia bacterium]